MNTRTTLNTLQNKKNNEKIVMITAYDALFASIFESEADILLVGDSLNMSFGAKPDTLSATLEQMIYHTNAVCAGAPNAFVVTDMPFGTYATAELALTNSIKVYQESGANAVKIEGGASKASIVQHLTTNGIAVMGHIGLLPQSVRAEGGYKIKGKNEANIASLVEDAKAIEAAGAFCIVVEGVKPEAAKAITEAVNIPTIGIGAGASCDGQVLVWSDMLGLNPTNKPKFVREYLKGLRLVKKAVRDYATDVKNGTFPSAEESY